MRAPPAAIAALVWAVVGPPLVAFAATRAQQGGIAVQVTLTSVSVVIEVGGGVGFSFPLAPSPALLTGIYNYIFLYVMAPP